MPIHEHAFLRDDVQKVERVFNIIDDAVGAAARRFAVATKVVLVQVVVLAQRARDGREGLGAPRHAMQKKNRGFSFHQA